MSGLWKTTREWDGLTCAVLASGPSMTRAVAETVRVSGAKTIAVNDQAIAVNGQPAMAPWADILYAADQTWWHENKEAISAFRGRKVTISPAGGSFPNVISDDILVIGNGGAIGFDERLDHLRTGSNSGYQAVHLAVHLGARRVVLCGFDMHARRGEHWFGRHHWKSPKFGSQYELFLRRFNEGAPGFLQRAEVVNTVSDSALRCFPFMSLEEALDVSDVQEDTGVAAPASSGSGAVGFTVEAAPATPQGAA